MCPETGRDIGFLFLTQCKYLNTVFLNSRNERQARMISTPTANNEMLFLALELFIHFGGFSMIPPCRFIKFHLPSRRPLIGQILLSINSEGGSRHIPPDDRKKRRKNKVHSCCWWRLKEWGREYKQLKLVLSLGKLGSAWSWRHTARLQTLHPVVCTSQY